MSLVFSKDGDRALLVTGGQVVAVGEDSNADSTCQKVQDLLDRDHPSAFDLQGVEGTLSELNARVFVEWLV
jgi:hypothetical protein